MRESLKGQELSFTEIAKLVGERWQTLSPNSREACERQAAAAKEKYYAELAEYKKTPEYAQYQEYLAEFRAKHNQQQSGQPSQNRYSSSVPQLTPLQQGKRSKVEPENSHNARSNGYDVFDKSARRRVSDAYFNQPALVHHRSGSSPPTGPPRTGGRVLGSESTSPATYSFSGINSPRMAGQYSPMSASPTSASAFREPEFSHPSTSTQSTDSRERLQDTPFSSNYGLGFPHSNSSAATPSTSSIYSGLSERDLPSRRINRETSSIPSLVHEDTNTTNQSSESGSYLTNNSNSSSNHHNTPYTGSLLPLADAQKAHRLLPQPIPSSLSMAPSPLDQRSVLPPQPPTKFPTAQPPGPDPRQASSLAVLLRAGEMARDRDADPTGGKDNSP